jgi:hypothetical protein
MVGWFSRGGVRRLQDEEIAVRQIILVAALGAMTAAGYSQCLQPVQADRCRPVNLRSNRLINLLSSDAVFGFVPQFVTCGPARDDVTVSSEGKIVLNTPAFTDLAVGRHLGSLVHAYTHLWQNGNLPGKYGELQADYVAGYIAAHYHDDTDAGQKVRFDEITRDGKFDPTKYGTLAERASAFLAGSKVTSSSLRTVLNDSLKYYDDLSGCGTARALLAGSLRRYEGLTLTESNDSPWTASSIAPEGASACEISSDRRVYQCRFPPDNLEDAGRRVRGISEGFRACAPPSLLVRNWPSSASGGTARMFWSARDELRTVVDVFEQGRAVTLVLRTLDPDPVPRIDTKPPEPVIPEAERPPEIVIGDALRVSPATARRLKVESDSLRMTSLQMQCDDRCPVAPVMQTIADARSNTLKALAEAHYTALASYADVSLTRASSELTTAHPEHLPRQRLVKILGRISDAIDSLVESASATITLRVSLLPKDAILRLWPVLYPQGGKPPIPSGVTITVFRGKYKYEVRTETLRLIADELNLIDAKGEELVCGSDTKPTPCSVK